MKWIFLFSFANAPEWPYNEAGSTLESGNSVTNSQRYPLRSFKLFGPIC